VGLKDARVIGIDVGTSGVRAAALADDGATVGSAAVAMETFGDATAPATWWTCVRAVISKLGSSCELSQVRALAVDGTSGTMLAVDRVGEPVGPARMYDEPCTDEAVIRAIAEHAPAESAARGATSALARALMMQSRPGVRHMLHQADWISGKLSGRFDRSDWNNALKTGYDPIAARWPDWIERTGADLRKLPVVLEPGAAIGQVSAEAVGLGVPESAIVHAGTTDGCASFLATGASEAGDGVTALGSTLVVKLLCDHPIFAPEFGIYSHRIGSKWFAGGASNTGGKVIGQFFPRDRLAELSAGLNPERPTGLNYYPLLKPGERFPINDPKLPPRLEPRPEDDATFLQAILEGVAEVEALAYRKLAELGAPPLRSVRTVGGGAANSAWTKIRERKLAAPFKPAESQEASAGVARLALQSLRNLG
jgi:sugar (pentulose or hexulose) kinase